MQECQRSFDNAKSMLTSSNVLWHYDPSLPIKMAGDASAYGIGAVISYVLPDGSEHPVAFASCSLSSSERNYTQVEKEALLLASYPGPHSLNDIVYREKRTRKTEREREAWDTTMRKLANVV